MVQSKFPIANDNLEKTMSKEQIERLEEILSTIPKRYRPKLKQDNIFDEFYIELQHDKYPKISVDINEIVVHRHKGIFGMFGHPSVRIRMFSTCDGNDWEKELMEILSK